MLSSVSLIVLSSDQRLSRARFLNDSKHHPALVKTAPPKKIELSITPIGRVGARGLAHLAPCRLSLSRSVEKSRAAEPSWIWVTHPHERVYR